MEKYKDFKEYMEEKFYDDIFNRIKSFVAGQRDSFESDEIYNVKWVEVDDIHVSGVTFKEMEGGFLEIRTSVDADVDVEGKARYGYDHFAVTKTYNVFFQALLENGLQQVKITKVEEYNPNTYERDRSLSQNLVPYMYEEDVEKHAEDFLKRHYPKALLQPMAIPVEEIVQAMGMKLFYAPLEEGIFGKTYFGSEKVSVFTNIIGKETVEIITEPGTMLINPNVFFMYNIGTANNTIIHECVHWDRHRRPFELQKLLTGECNHISCEIVEVYDGIPQDAPALKWMEWQANQLAPRILMPAKMTERVYNNALRDIHASKPFKRFAEVMEEAVGFTAQYFGVSLLAAKLRLMDLGYDVVQGTFVYSDGKYLPPFYFTKGTLEKHQTYVIDEQSALIQIFMSDELRALYLEGRLTYANCMVCINAPKYVTRSETGQPILTEYALEHVHECCFVFERKISASDTYSDSFYRRCFLCRDVSSETFIEAKYNPEHKDNQSKFERRDEINKITESVADIVNRLANEIPGGFAGTLNYHMNRKGITNEELAARTNISTVSISDYRNTMSPKITLERATALCNGLKLEKHYAHDLMRKAGYDLSTPNIIYFMVGWVIDEHPDDTLQQWQDKFNDAHINVKLPGCA
ncbi:MAG: helix-turn-helix transcriptional regulator [Lachnospiraceae bacterium]|nr:helix-turn-helix transcriptional regulator [Lachnospiraceae bacterium]